MLRKIFFSAVLITFAASLVLFGCAPDQGGEPKPNVAPETFILNVPPDSSIIAHDAAVFWNGSDPDGVVLGYFVRLLYEDLNGQPQTTPWTFTSLTQKNIALYAPDDVLRLNTFQVVAVDQSGNGEYDSVQFPANLGGGAVPEPFDDINGDGVWNSDTAEPWTDNDGDGVVDPGEYQDINENDFWDEHIAENFLDLGAIDETPAENDYFTSNIPPTLTITTQPPDWTGGDVTKNPIYCLEELTRIWDGLGIFWIGQDENDAIFPLFFRWELYDENDQLIRKTNHWIQADFDTPFNGNVVFTTHKTYHQRGSSFIDYDEMEPGLIEYAGNDGIIVNDMSYYAVVWASDASVAVSEPDTTEFYVIVPTFEKDILLVDETKANDLWLGRNLFEEEEINQFYLDIIDAIPGISFNPETDIHDFTSGNVSDAPTKLLFSQYKTVLWFNDDKDVALKKGIDYDGDFSSDVQYDELLVQYMDVGGNVILCGWQLLQAFPNVGNVTEATFFANHEEFQYLHIDKVVMDDEGLTDGEFIGVQAYPITLNRPNLLGIPDYISIDNEKVGQIGIFAQGDIPALPFVSVFHPLIIHEDPYVDQMFYTFDSKSGNPNYENPDDGSVYMYKTDTFNSVLIGFPLFLMDNTQGQVTTMMQKIFEFISEPYVAE